MLPIPLLPPGIALPSAGEGARTAARAEGAGVFDLLFPALAPAADRQAVAPDGKFLPPVPAQSPEDPTDHPEAATEPAEDAEDDPDPAALFGWCVTALPAARPAVVPIEGGQATTRRASPAAAADGTAMARASSPPAGILPDVQMAPASANAAAQISLAKAPVRAAKPVLATPAGLAPPVFGNAPAAKGSSPEPPPAGSPLPVPAPSASGAPALPALAQPSLEAGTAATAWRTAPAPAGRIGASALAHSASLAPSVDIGTPTRNVSSPAEPSPPRLALRDPPPPAAAVSASPASAQAFVGTMVPAPAPAAARPSVRSGADLRVLGQEAGDGGALGMVSATLLAVAPQRVGAVLPSPLDMSRDSWPQAMIDRIETLRDAADAVDTSIRLVPEALGKIDVSLRRDGDTVHVHFAAEQAQTRALLHEAQPRLADLAEARGLKLTQGDAGGGDPGRRPPPTVPWTAPSVARRTAASETQASAAAHRIA